MDFKRRGLGGIDVGVSNNPDFKRGMLKGMCKSILSHRANSFAVCKVVYERTNNDPISEIEKPILVEMCEDGKLE